MTIRHSNLTTKTAYLLLVGYKTRF